MKENKKLQDKITKAIDQLTPIVNMSLDTDDSVDINLANSAISNLNCLLYELKSEYCKMEMDNLYSLIESNSYEIESTMNIKIYSDYIDLLSSFRRHEYKEFYVVMDKEMIRQSKNIRDDGGQRIIFPSSGLSNIMSCCGYGLINSSMFVMSLGAKVMIVSIKKQD